LSGKPDFFGTNGHQKADLPMHSLALSLENHAQTMAILAISRVPVADCPQ
jgi:hypothetical protein